MRELGCKSKKSVPELVGGLRTSDFSFDSPCMAVGPSLGPKRDADDMVHAVQQQQIAEGGPRNASGMATDPIVMAGEHGKVRSQDDASMDKCVNCGLKTSPSIDIYLCCSLDQHSIRCKSEHRPLVLNNCWFELCEPCFLKSDARKLIAGESAFTPECAPDHEVYEALFGNPGPEGFRAMEIPSANVRGNSQFAFVRCVRCARLGSAGNLCYVY